MKRPRQLSLIKEPRRNTKLWWIVKKKVYGGSFNYRKVQRPFDSKQLAHIVFKARTGPALRFTRSSQSIRKLVISCADAQAVKITNLAINHDHIHMLLSCNRKDALVRFIREFSSKMGKVYKSLAQKFGIVRTTGLWIHRPFSRLLSWGRRSRQIINSYFKKNRLEAIGFLDYQPRKSSLALFLKRWEQSNKVFSSA